jgi:DNA polymerase
VDLDVEARETLEAVRTFIKAQAEYGLTEFRLARRDAGARLADFHESIRDCRMCGLSEGRRTVVFGSGSPNADLMFVGEAPGADEDRTGLPFVGSAGALLTRMIEAIGFQREDVYIANVIKCRPPGNRDPMPAELQTCRPYLERQVALIQPVAICALGRFAAQTLLETGEPLGELRGRLFSYRGIHLIPTYHPAALLRNRQWKRPAWQDLQLLRRVYDGASG